MLKILFIDLFFNPRKFFQEQMTFCRKYYFWFICIAGVYYCLNKFVTLCLRAEIEKGDRFKFLSMMSWSIYWIFILVMSIITGISLWWFNGWCTWRVFCFNKLFE